jgi:hypothetical protein
MLFDKLESNQPGPSDPSRESQQKLLFVGARQDFEVAALRHTRVLGAFPHITNSSSPKNG